MRDLVREIPDFPKYKVGRDGNVFNNKGLKLKGERTRNGYIRVSLSNDNVKHQRKSVHRLVAEAFIPNPDCLPQVNHIDKNKHNNRVENLEWCTPIDNLQHSGVIEKASIAKFTKVKCTTTGETYNSIKEASDYYKIPHSNIVACCNGRRSKAGGLEWKYVE